MNKQTSELATKIVNMCDASIEFYQKLKDDMFRLDQATCNEFDVCKLYCEAFQANDAEYAAIFCGVNASIDNILYGDLFEEEEE
jgi:ferredoxin-like protein FixX